MSSKKQMVIIAVLIVLIGCVGVFGIEINKKSGVGDPLAVKTNNDNESVTSFSESRMGRENQRSAMKLDYEKIMNSKDATQEAKKDASDKLIALLDRAEKEDKIESLVKEDGYDDALCFIDENGVEMCVKSKETLTDVQVNQIKDIIVRTTKVSPNNITIKQRD